MTEISGVKVIDTDAIHDNVDGEINAVANKAAPVGGDLIIIEDSEASFAKKKLSITNLPGGADPDAIHDNVADEITGITNKATVVDADELLIEDSENTYNKKAVLASVLKTYIGAGGIANVVEDTTPQLGGDLDLNSKGITEEFQAGEILVDGDLCFLETDGKMWKADASVDTTSSQLLGMCKDALAADATGTFLLFGKYTMSGLTAGSLYFVSLTAGAVTLTRPTASTEIVRIVGTALSTTVLYFTPDPTYIEIA